MFPSSLSNYAARGEFLMARSRDPLTSANCEWLAWINENGAVIQAFSLPITIAVAVLVVMLTHHLANKRAERADRRERLRIMESVASIVIATMNRIDFAAKKMCGDSLDDTRDVEDMLNFVENWESKVAASFAVVEKALDEVPITQLPKYEAVLVVIEMRLLIDRVADKIREIDDALSEESRPGKLLKDLRSLHAAANAHTSNMEALVNELRDEKT